jgi:hypothetical protein
MRNIAVYFVSLMTLVGSAALHAEQPTEGRAGQAEYDGNVYPTQYTVYKDNYGQTELISVAVQDTNPGDDRTNFQISRAGDAWRITPCEEAVCTCQVQEDSNGGGTATCTDPGKQPATVIYRFFGN